MGQQLSSIKPPQIYRMSLLFMAATKVAFPRAAPIFSFCGPGFLWGVPVFIAGAKIAVDSKQTFQETGTPMMGGPTETSPFHTDGHYSWTRNPMYLGISVALGGVALISNCYYNFAFPVMNALIMDRCFIPREEKELEDKFGKDYNNYKATVRRWF